MLGDHIDGDGVVCVCVGNVVMCIDVVCMCVFTNSPI